MPVTEPRQGIEMDVELIVSAVDHPELSRFAKLICSTALLHEELVPQRFSVSTSSSSRSLVAPLVAAVHLARSSPLSPQLPSSLCWLEFAFKHAKPALKTGTDPHGQVLGVLQGCLKGRAFLEGDGQAPSLADWAVWGVVADTVSGLTPTVARERYWRVVRWGEYLRVLGEDAGVRVKPFDMALLSASLPEAEAAAGKNRAAPKTGCKNPGTPDAQILDPAARLDIRVGRIVDVTKHPNADRLYIERVDFGESEQRTVVSGLVEHVPMEVLQNRLACFLCNLKPASICKTLSQAMILVGKADDGEKVELLCPPSGSVPGDRVFFGGIEPKPDEQLKSKENVWPTAQAKLHIVKEGRVVYGDSSEMATSRGPVTVSLDSGVIS